MDDQKIPEIQNKILDLSPNRLGTDLKFCCSEISRLIIKWFFDLDKTYKPYILKGDSIMGSKMSHDILALEKDGTYLIIDPTIWQFFPDAKTILVYKGDNLKNGIDIIQRKYDCSWVLGSQEKVPSPSMEKEYLRIIKEIINENLSEGLDEI